MDALKRMLFLYLLESDLLDAEVAAAEAELDNCIVIPLKGKYRVPR